MRGEEFLAAMEYIDPALIEEADLLPEKRRGKRPVAFALGTAAAACFAVLIGLGFWNSRGTDGIELETTLETADRGAEEVEFETEEAIVTAAIPEESAEDDTAVGAAWDIAEEESAESATRDSADEFAAKAAMPTLALAESDELAKRLLTAFDEGTEVAGDEEAQKAPLLTVEIRTESGTTRTFFLYENAIAVDADEPERLVKIDEETADLLFSGGD